jgi:hypothetical protein
VAGVVTNPRARGLRQRYHDLLGTPELPVRTEDSLDGRLCLYSFNLVERPYLVGPRPRFADVEAHYANGKSIVETLDAVL